MGLFGSSNIGLFDGGDAPVEQLFTTNGTWSCCPGALKIEVIAVGGGGGGNGGGKCNVGANRGNAGGQGGGGGGFVIATLLGAQVPTSACVTIGAAGSGAPITNGNGSGCNGTDGGNTSFGTCLIACGGKAGNNGSGTTRLGGYANATFGGVNGCGGLGGAATINTGTGFARSGNCGGEMVMTCFTPQSNLNGRDGEAGIVSPRGGGAAGAVAKDGSGVAYCGLGGVGYGGFTCCGLTIGGGGQGGNAEACAGTNATSYGGGGGGSAATLSGQSEAAGAGFQGVVKVIQYFR
jgi:hypothetical protein